MSLAKVGQAEDEGQDEVEDDADSTQSPVHGPSFRLLKEDSQGASPSPRHPEWVMVAP
jgi:hypothetical protein